MRRSSNRSTPAPSTATASAASPSAAQNPKPSPSAPASRCASVYARYRPTMKNEPCAKLTIRVTPKISDRPAATRNSDDAAAGPVMNLTSKPQKLMTGKSLCRASLPWSFHHRYRKRFRGHPRSGLRPAAGCAPSAQQEGVGGATRSARSLGVALLVVACLLDQVVGRLEFRAVVVLEVDHHALAPVVLRRADERAERRLMVLGTVGDPAERRVDLQAGERGDQLVGVGAAGLADAGGDRLDLAVADHRALARVVVVLRLVRLQERIVRGRVDAVPGVAGDDPSIRRVVLQRVEVFGLAGQHADHRAALEQASDVSLAHELGEVDRKST